jgi:ankyrin repeat protein
MCSVPSTIKSQGPWFRCIVPALPVVKVLLRAGADVLARTDQLATPLHLAAGGNHGEVTRFLIKRVSLPGR